MLAWGGGTFRMAMGRRILWELQLRAFAPTRYHDMLGVAVLHCGEPVAQDPDMEVVQRIMRGSAAASGCCHSKRPLPGGCAASREALGKRRVPGRACSIIGTGMQL